jgi:hypothetical protein
LLKNEFENDPAQLVKCSYLESNRLSMLEAQYGNNMSSFPRQDLGNFLRIAVLYEDDLHKVQVGNKLNWRQIANQLTRDEGTYFDYFKATYASPDGFSLTQNLLNEIEARHRVQAYDLMLILGSSDVEPDIGLIHQLLAPWIARQACLDCAVYTALGPDDGNTVLGDTASKTFDTPEYLMQAVAATIRKRHHSLVDVVNSIQSLSRFLLTEHHAESKIIVQTALIPALRKHLSHHLHRFDQEPTILSHIASSAEKRIAQERTSLNSLRSRIEQEIARLTESPRVWRRRFTSTMRKVQFSLLVIFLAMIVFTGWWTTLANTVFIGGCLLIVLSGIYVAISNRLWDETRAAPISLEPRLSSTFDD